MKSKFKYDGKSRPVNDRLTKSRGIRFLDQTPWLKKLERLSLSHK